MAVLTAVTGVVILHSAMDTLTDCIVVRTG